MTRIPPLPAIYAGVLTFIASVALAQQSLPTIEIGAAQRRIAQGPTGRPETARSEGSVTSPPVPSGPAAAHPPAEENNTYHPQNAMTALKTNTPIMNTPASIQVVPREVMRDQQVVEISQAVNNVSGVIAADERQGLVPSIWIRGFQTNNYYLDGVRMASSPTNTNQNMANVDRVEVLKGPASILYGRGDPGGLINLVTKVPLETPYSKLEQQIGTWGQFRTTLDSTGPLTKDNTLLYRINVAYETGHDFFNYSYARDVFIAPKLRWNIDNHTFFDLYMTYQDRGSPIYSTAIPFTGPGPNSANPLYTLLFGNGGAPNTFLQRSLNFAQPWSRTGSQEYIAGFNWSHDLNENWNIKQRFQAQITDFNSTFSGPFLYNDFDANPFTIDNWTYRTPHISTNSYYTNVDLTGHVETGDIKHTLLFGTDYQHFRLSGSQLYAYPESFGGTVPPTFFFTPYQAPFSLLDPNSLIFYGYHESWLGAYAQDQIELPYNIHVLAGGRYDDIKLYDDINQTVATNAQRVTPRFGLLWRPIPEMSIYGSYSQSYGNSPLAATRPVKPESAEQWEVGVKTELFDKRLTSTFAFYNLIKKNVAVPIDQTGLVFSSIGEVRNQGFEFDVAGEILPSWKVIGNYSFIQSEITKDGTCDLAGYALYAESIVNFTFDQALPSSCIVDAYSTFVQFNPILLSAFGNKGRRNPGVPRHAGSIWSTYEFKGGELHGLKIGAGIIARSDSFGDLFNSYFLPGYATFNMMAAYETRIADQKVTFQLNANNLLDTRYYSITNPGYFAIATGTPRNVRGSIKVEF